MHQGLLNWWTKSCCTVPWAVLQVAVIFSLTCKYISSLLNYAPC